MKSVSFLRNTFKKWEQKALSDDKQSTKGRDSTNLSRSSSRKEPLSARSLNVAVKQLPLVPPEPLTAATIDGSWGTPYPGTYGPSSTTSHARKASLTGEIPYFGKGTTYRKFSFSSTDVPSLSSSGRNGRAEKSHQITAVEHRDTSTRSNGTSWPALTRKFTARLSPNSSPLRIKGPPSRPPSPQSPSLPSFPLLPPIDLGHTHVKFDSFSGIRKQSCQCSSNHSSDCPRYIHLETPREVVSSNVGSDVLKSSPKTVHAVLDMSVDTKPRRLYHNSGSSTPHLPYNGRGSPPLRRLGTASSIDSEAGSFPLSLFPVPPPLIVRKKIPAPLVLRTSPPPRSSQSSRDSTPLGTPTTPRFQQVCSLSQSGFVSPTKKIVAVGRPTASITPPKYSPPNSPLPEIPTFIPGYERQRTASAQSVRPPLNRPLRSFSNNNLRDTVTSFSVNQRHRLTSSEPITDQSSLPIKRSTPPKPRPAPLMLRTHDLKSHVEISNSDQVVTPSGTVESVQWGYAF